MIVLLILTRECYEAMRAAGGAIEGAGNVYVNCDVLTAAEASELVAAGVNLTCFKQHIHAFRHSAHK
jgi:hypothetical protein